MTIAGYHASPLAACKDQSQAERLVQFAINANTAGGTGYRTSATTPISNDHMCVGFKARPKTIEWLPAACRPLLDDT